MITNKIFVDQSVIAAALNGRVLVIEGLEVWCHIVIYYVVVNCRPKNAERNVLPVLNNLLENREMSLEDGRFLVAPKRYGIGFPVFSPLTFPLDMFLRDKDKYGNVSERLVKVHKRFRVIAIGIPVPVCGLCGAFAI
jgi:von Willebrand factor A domain-containing protein 8